MESWWKDYQIWSGVFRLLLVAIISILRESLFGNILFSISFRTFTSGLISYPPYVARKHAFEFVFSLMLSTFAFHSFDIRLQDSIIANIRVRSLDCQSYFVNLMSMLNVDCYISFFLEFFFLEDFLYLFRHLITSEIFGFLLSQRCVFASLFLEIFVENFQHLLWFH